MKIDLAFTSHYQMNAWSTQETASTLDRNQLEDDSRKGGPHPPIGL